MRMDGQKIMLRCLVCDREFQCGPSIYNGRFIGQWDAAICDTCIKFNWDGIVPSVRPHVIEHLKERKIPYSLNSNGWLDIPS
jgi:hypothetical protein